MKPIKIYETTVKDVLLDNPQGSYVYRIMFNDSIPFYVGITLKGVKDRFKTHMAKFAGIKKYNDRPKCQEMVFESKELKFKCIGRQTYGYNAIRDILKKNKIKYDMFNAKVTLEQFSEEALNDYGTDIGTLTNKFYFEKYESNIIEKELPLANDETIHLADNLLKFKDIIKRK